MMKTASRVQAGLLVVLTLAVRGIPAHAQSPGTSASMHESARGCTVASSDFTRPALPDTSADPNDPTQYYALGLQLAGSTPGSAAIAFRWAAHLAPDWGRALHAERAALLLADEALRLNFLRGKDPIGRSTQLRVIDSLQLLAWARDPLAVRDLDSLLALSTRETILRNTPPVFSPNLRGQATGTTDGNAALRSSLLDNPTGSGTDYARGMGSAQARAAGSGPLLRQPFDGGASLPSRPPKYSAAVAEAVVVLLRHEVNRFGPLSPTSPIWQYTRGASFEAAGQLDSARIAYAAAIQNDSAYWPAWLRIGELSMRRGREGYAVAAMALARAAALRPTDPVVRQALGVALAASGRASEALAEFATARECNAVFALPHVLSGRIYDAAGYTDEALQYYRSFVARARRSDPEKARALERIAALETARADSIR